MKRCCHRRGCLPPKRFRGAPPRPPRQKGKPTPVHLFPFAPFSLPKILEDSHFVRIGHSGTAVSNTQEDKTSRRPPPGRQPSLECQRRTRQEDSRQSNYRVRRSTLRRIDKQINRSPARFATDHIRQILETLAVRPEFQPADPAIDTRRRWHESVPPDLRSLGSMSEFQLRGGAGLRVTARRRLPVACTPCGGYQAGASVSTSKVRE